jgi:hypothetical protein
MSTLIHCNQDGREFKHNHAPQESERPRRTRKPTYSRTLGRASVFGGFRGRRNKRFV